MIRFSFPTLLRKIPGTCAAGLFLWPLAVAAQTPTPSQAFGSVQNGDLAKAWIDYLFRGDTMPDALASYALPLAFAADGLRQALGVYSIGMLVIAAMLVFYHIAAMVAETAHSGTPFGRRANQIWTPIRFVIAISLLVPVSSSLSAGQYLVLKIAGEGSTMASNAWSTVAQGASGHLSGLVTPRGPDVAHLVATAVEMETCRALYQQIYAPLDSDTSIHIAGNIGDIAKLPADRFSVETWRYTNALNASVPLCGEYRFPGYRRALFGTHMPDSTIARMAENLSGFAHSTAEDVQNQARNMGDQAAGAFMSAAAPIGADVHTDLASLETSLTGRLNSEKQDMNTVAGNIADQTLTESVDAGWVAAASFIPELVRLQDSYSELMEHALPVAQSPVFAHQKMMQRILNEAVATSPYFAPLNGAVPEKLNTFYNQVSRVTTQVHGWVYNTQLPDKDSVAPVSADLYDRLNAATDPDSISSFYTQALDASAFTAGVWGESVDSTDTGYPFSTVPATAVYNPFAALVEFGRRQTELASTLVGLSGSGLSAPGATGPSLLFGVTGFLFFLGGVLLIFVVPLLPFIRFLMAVVVWIINVFEAVVAMPLVALAHLTPMGGGLSGSVARQAYMLWLSLLIRPILTLFGFVFGLLVFSLSLAFIDAVLTPFARLALSSNGGFLAGANIGLVLLYDVLAYAAANASFKGIHWLPEQALRWTSTFVVTDGASDAPAQVSVNAVSGPAGTTIVSPSVANAMTSMAGGANVHVSTSGGATGTTASGGSTGPRSGNAMKMALFPSYGDKSDITSSTQGPGGLSSTSTHISERSVSGPSNTNVNVSASMTSSFLGGSSRPGRERGRDDKPGKNRLSGGENEASAGGDEKPAKDAPKETPQDDT